MLSIRRSSDFLKKNDHNKKSNYEKMLFVMYAFINLCIIGGSIHAQQHQGEPRDQLTPYERGPPLSYMERMAEKRNLEEVKAFIKINL